MILYLEVSSLVESHSSIGQFRYGEMDLREESAFRTRANRSNSAIFSKLDDDGCRAHPR